MKRKLITFVLGVVLGAAIALNFIPAKALPQRPAKFECMNFTSMQVCIRPISRGK